MGGGARAGPLARHHHAGGGQRRQPRPRGGARGRPARPGLPRVPARALAAVRRAAIEGEGAEVRVVDGTYEQCVALARADGERSDTLEIADVGDSGPAYDVIDGYATLFDEAARQAEFDALVVPVGVGSLAAAAARFGARGHPRDRRGAGRRAVPDGVAGRR